jgi:hypothetical protein
LPGQQLDLITGGGCCCCCCCCWPWGHLLLLLLLGPSCIRQPWQVSSSYSSQQLQLRLIKATLSDKNSLSSLLLLLLLLLCDRQLRVLLSFGLLCSS